jgi:signal transduction histidine kinase
MEWITDISVKILVSISGLLGVGDLPLSPVFREHTWKFQQAWTPYENGYSIRATSSDIGSYCEKHPGHTVEFPRIIQGAHQIFADRKLVTQFGDPEFATARSFYGAPSVGCSALSGARLVEWRAFSYMSYYARTDQLPQTKAFSAVSNLISESFNILATGLLCFNFLIAFILFRHRVPIRDMSYLLASCALFAGYFVGSVPGLIGIQISMLVAHKLALSSVFAGIGCFFMFLRERQLLSQKNARLGFVGFAGTIFFIAAAPSADSVQLATTLGFPIAVVLMISSTFRSLSRLLHDSEHRISSIFQFVSLSIFLGTIMNDIMMVLGVYSTEPLLSIGIVGALMFSSTSLNEYVHEVYRERNYLRENLEAEVESKTAALNDRTNELQSAMRHLKSTQAELVQSAKLASIGTLSAGIAHEINNSLNYVSGAIRPLEKIVQQGLPEISQRKAAQLLNCMREGLRLTFDIMNSLRNVSGVNRAKFDEVKLADIVHSVMTISKSRLNPKVKINVHIPDKIELQCNVVGINQVLMNLLINASDAIPGEGTIDIAARAQQGNIIIRIADSGTGIPNDILDKVFDPFFTTKDVKKGSGLGLFIVKQELDRHQGNIRINSKIGSGTEVQIILPARAHSEDERSAA